MATVVLLVVLKIEAHCEGDVVDSSHGHLYQQILVKESLLLDRETHLALGIFPSAPH